MKGMMFDFVLGVIILGFLMVLYVSADYAYDTTLYPHAQTAITDTDAQKTVALINIIWTYFPLVMIFAFLIFMIVRAQKRNPYEEG